MKQGSIRFTSGAKAAYINPLTHIDTKMTSWFVGSRRVNEAVKVFDELENSNSKADIISYNSLINCLGKNGDLDEAHMRPFPLRSTSG
ncbi:hypothetical protein RJ640_012358 [Escallonia rubra]|uniref:Pentatricopeptide repeat-containing protein n=1 Tax=Escallonia rubra TaxID=112253 RepID=A0AA88QZA5_9ASTE|nr:hypothetical protein RJ640_012358 [Escallonia rubra]